MPTTTVWEQVQTSGERLVASQKHKQGQVGLERTQWEQSRYDGQLRKGVSLDGGMVNVRGEGWKEFKVGVVTTLVPPQNQTENTAAITHDPHYTAVLGDVEAFAPALWALAVEHAIPYAGHVVVTADGAPWIWRLSADLFPCATQIVDYYHATQHLAEAAQALYPTDPQAAIRFFNDGKDCLLTDEVWKIIAPSTLPTCPISPPTLRSIASACYMPCSALKAIPSVLAPLKVLSNSSNTVSLARVCAGRAPVSNGCSSFVPPSWMTLFTNSFWPLKPCPHSPTHPSAWVS